MDELTGVLLIVFEPINNGFLCVDLRTGSVRALWPSLSFAGSAMMSALLMSVDRGASSPLLSSFSLLSMGLPSLLVEQNMLLPDNGWRRCRPLVSLSKGHDKVPKLR